MMTISEQESDILEIEPDHHNGLPLIKHRNLDSFQFGEHLFAAHKISYRPGITVDFLSRLKKSDFLVVALHGAITPGSFFYPQFTRESSLRALGASSLHFGDPTLQLSKNEEMRLSWYLGGPGWDPLYAIASVVRQAMRELDISNVMFTGGSGGGFAAMRISVLFPGSLAFVQDPQTSIRAYYPGAVGRYFSNVWPNDDQNKLMDDFPTRFDMNALYRDYRPDNFVYYYQNETDNYHREKHFEPFAAANGIPVAKAEIETQNRKMVLVKGEKDGHGKITAAEFDHHYKVATSWWLS